MKIISNIILLFVFLFINIVGVFADENLNVGKIQNKNQVENQALDTLGKNEGKFFEIRTGGERGVYYSLINIAKSMKNVFFFLAGIYLLVLILRMLLADKSEDEISRYKKGIIWISIGLVVMQIAYSFVILLFDSGVSGGVAANLIANIMNPLIDLLETGAALFFIGIAIYSFYKIITANGNEDAISAGKKSIVYAMGGFIIIKFARAIVGSVYGVVNCDQASYLGGLVKLKGSQCLQDANLSDFSQIIITIINWANAFVGIIVIIMIIYAGFQVLLSAGDEEKLKKAKNAIIYIAIGIALLVINYLILTFFIFPESTI